ncbi:PLP-dependent aminotransferase family protein [Streptomyces californicus]
MLKAVAARLGVTLVPLAMDEEGLIPEAVAEAHRTEPLHAVYVQPVLHNPLGRTMFPRRLDHLADVLLTSGIHAVEDAVWAFLRDDLRPSPPAPGADRARGQPLQAARPGLTVGFAVARAPLAGRVTAALRSGGWAHTRFPLEAMARCARGRNRRDPRAGQAAGGAGTAGDRATPSRRLPDERRPRFVLPLVGAAPPWRADTFVAAAARHAGAIAVTPAAAFRVGRRSVPHAIRLGLASPTRHALSHALTTLADLARTAPHELTDA